LARAVSAAFDGGGVGAGSAAAEAAAASVCDVLQPDMSVSPNAAISDLTAVRE
jgi:hypothetical protein